MLCLAEVPDCCVCGGWATCMSLHQGFLGCLVAMLWGPWWANLLASEPAGCPNSMLSTGSANRAVDGQQPRTPGAVAASHPIKVQLRILCYIMLGRLLGATRCDASFIRKTFGQRNSDWQHMLY